MAEIWIHRKCARPKSEDYAGDELILPKQVDETRRRTCEVCRGYEPTLGAVYLHKGNEVNWTIHRVPPITEGVSGPPGSLEYNPTEVPDLILPKEEVAESIPEEPFVKAEMRKIAKEAIEKVEAETVEEDEISVGEAVTVLEEPPEAEPEPSVTLEVKVDAEKAQASLDKLEAQIAKLQAKKDALAK